MIAENEVFSMKHILACALLVSAVLLGGCAGTSLYRGVDASSGAFVSTYSPVVSVKAAQGYEQVLSGYTLCRVPFENSMLRTLSADTWFSLQAGEGSQLVSVLAECPNEYIWEVRPVGVDFQTLKVFYEHNGMSPNDATVHVYVRPASMDPWTPLFAQAGKAAWQGDTLVARYEWTGGADISKLIVEYREPAPEVLPGLAMNVEDLTAFIGRSQKAFTLEGVTSPVSPRPRETVNVPDRLLAPVLGVLSTNQIFTEL